MGPERGPSCASWMGADTCDIIFVYSVHGKQGGKTRVLIIYRGSRLHNNWFPGILQSPHRAEPGKAPPSPCAARGALPLGLGLFLGVIPSVSMELALPRARPRLATGAQWRATPSGSWGASPCNQMCLRPQELRKEVRRPEGGCNTHSNMSWTNPSRNLGDHPV